MHVLVVTDQHPDSLGGVQVAIRLQRQALERLGHRVTIVAPELHRAGYEVAEADREAYLDLPSRPITRDREYGITWPGARTDRALAARLAQLPPVDLVHVQGDFWGAMIGIRAARGLRVPIVHTMHNHVDAGTRAVTPFAPVAFQALRAWRFLALGKPRGSVSRSSRGAWRFLAELAADAAVVTAPSAHFAAELRAHSVTANVRVTPGGVDDQAIAAARAVPRAPRTRPRLVWLGRMSQEKRILEFIDAIAEADIDADIALHGAGLLLPRVRERIAAHGLGDRVTIPGPVPYAQALAAMRDADALVQTSMGFETQGLTPFEAAALGTPTIFCDPNIADDVAVQPEWRVPAGNVSALADTLRGAVAELRAGLSDPDLREAEAAAGGSSERASAGPLRVAEADGDRFLQSAQSRVMLEAYAAALAERA
ncbi:glycosyltransferase [Leucobacter chromiireducens]|uniref:D-inositol 3-phosphate glycosyltransferase n=1 Tax=Leucobacter chromiireducens subsp. chromiireducens TaxID=660067 RepID=A0ABS1SKC8_9MICO|nr:glycosyltransferase [Leucobacter chromiireducens]MBL3688620.1 glycosyltransferase [Leucobacter chromiireducens subsp. chromiireducens]